MNHAQGRVTTLHDLGDADPAAPTGDTAAVVPVTDRDAGADVAGWLDGVDVEPALVRCDGPRVVACLADAGLAVDLPLARGWGGEVGPLAAAFDRTGVVETIQVDLGVHHHVHRPVTGEDGLTDASETVGARLLRDVAGVSVEHAALRTTYRESAARYVDADAAFNGLAHDVDDERDQVARYAAAVRPAEGPDAVAAAADLVEVAS